MSLAHIGKIPVEEWLPFVVPLVALYLYGRRRERRRRAAVERLPPVTAAQAPETAATVLERWRRDGFTTLRHDHLALLWPPGPDGATADELAERIGDEVQQVREMLAELDELGYLEVESRDGFDGERAWLTVEGFRVLDATESALLSATEQPTPV